MSASVVFWTKPVKVGTRGLALFVFMLKDASLEEGEDRSRESAVRVSGTKYFVWMALYVSVV